MHYSYTELSALLEQISRTPPGIRSNTLLETLDALRDLVRKKEKALSIVPEGSLVVYRPHGRSVSPEYYHSQNGLKEYLPQERMSFARALAQKGYDEHQLREAIRLLRSLEQAASKDLSFHDAYENLRPERQALVEPDFLSDDEVRRVWSSIEYDSLGFSPNYPEYFTSDGVRVRSLAERRIGDRFHERGILYLYEFPFQMVDGGIVYPDFTCLNLRTRKLLRWEHLGRLDEGKYLQNSLRKLERYRASGIQLGVDLVVTQDTDGRPLTTTEIDRLVDTFLV